MCHLDVAGGTGDVAFRVLRAMKDDQMRQKEESDAPTPVPLGQVNVCDINPDMLREGQRKAQQQRLGTCTWLPSCAQFNALASCTIQWP